MKTIPPIDTRYWALLISSTVFGETAGDLISQSLGLGYAMSSIVLVGLFVASVFGSIVAPPGREIYYWITIIFASTAGTALSDYVTRAAGLGYLWGTVLLALSLLVILAIWNRLASGFSSEQISSIQMSTPIELLYWIAILTSSTLGTAFGDFISNDVGLGFAGGTFALFGLLLLVVGLMFKKIISRSASYWLAIIITHPLGATTGDYLTKPEGFNLGNVWSSVIVVAVFGLIVFLFEQRNREKIV